MNEIDEWKFKFITQNKKAKIQIPINSNLLPCKLQLAFLYIADDTIDSIDDIHNSNYSQL
jgi:hypothetical protein